MSESTPDLVQQLVQLRERLFAQAQQHDDRALTVLGPAADGDQVAATEAVLLSYGMAQCANHLNEVAEMLSQPDRLRAEAAGIIAGNHRRRLPAATASRLLH